MRFLPDERLYWDAGHCLSFLRELEKPDRDGASGERFHAYWRGPFTAKQAFSIKSILATQTDPEVWLWLDADDGYAAHESNPLLRSLPPAVSIRPFDAAVECRGTPLEGRADLFGDVDSVERSDLVRLVALHHHGGVYLDLDMMLLRDLGELFDQPFITEEFCYRWSADQPYANSAFLRLSQGSQTTQELLARSAKLGSCRPTEILRFDRGDIPDLTILPCAFFDPLWPHADGKSRLEETPFDGFDGFFRKFGWRFRQKREIGSYRDFFPGAFAYHWHNLWDAPEHERSYYGVFEREIDAELERGRRSTELTPA